MQGQKQERGCTRETLISPLGRQGVVLMQNRQHEESTGREGCMQGTEQKLWKLFQEKRQRAWSRSIAEMQRGQRMAIDLASETKKRGWGEWRNWRKEVKGKDGAKVRGWEEVAREAFLLSTLGTDKGRGGSLWGVSHKDKPEEVSTRQLHTFTLSKSSIRSKRHSAQIHWNKCNPFGTCLGSLPKEAQRYPKS